MNDQADLVSRMRAALLARQFDAAAYEGLCSEYLDLSRKTRAPTQKDLPAIDVTVTDSEE